MKVNFLVACRSVVGRDGGYDLVDVRWPLHIPPAAIRQKLEVVCVWQLYMEQSDFGRMFTMGVDLLDAHHRSVLPDDWAFRDAPFALNRAGMAVGTNRAGTGDPFMIFRQPIPLEHCPGDGLYCIVLRIRRREVARSYIRIGGA